MELRDEIKAQFRRSHELAKRYYDEGDIARARVEYLKCAEFLRQLAKQTPSKREELLERAEKFAEIAEGLREGRIKIFTNGVVLPEEVPASGKTVEEREEGKAKGFILAEKPGIRFDDIAGLDEVKERIKEAIVYPFKYPDEYRYYGV
ncbi:MAG: hypothetical protein DRP08_03190, partial [Candidatus Aenigmatarchaeota archaeon]